MPIPFTKMHGLGNDYVYVDAFDHPVPLDLVPDLARAVSDRHCGIGSDGLILVAPPEPGVDADVRMIMFNADGSRGEMCGNGIRCVVKYAVESGRVPAPIGATTALQSELNAPMAFLAQDLGASDVHSCDVRVQTDRGVLPSAALMADGAVRSVRVDMDEPILTPAKIPVDIDGHLCIRRPIDVAGMPLTMTCVSMGNPHAVFFVDDDVTAIDLARIGPMIERHVLFPRRVNAHFVRVQSVVEATMRTWERGSGETRACGTGACAVLVAGVLEDRLSRDAILHLPGGDLRIEWPEGGHVFKTGTAEVSFTGVWPWNAGEP